MAKRLSPQEVRKGLRPFLDKLKLPNPETENETYANESSAPFEEEKSPFHFRRENKEEAK